MTDKRLKVVAVSLIFVVLPLCGFSQSMSDSSSARKPVLQLASTIAGDLRHISTAPFRLSKNDVVQLSSFIGLNVAMMYGFDNLADEEFALEGHNTYLKPTKQLVKVGEVYDRIGSIQLGLALSATMLTSGLIFKDKKLMNTSRLLIESLSIASGITWLSKRIVGRSRPYTNSGARVFDPLSFRNSSHGIRAMPSGHATSAFAMMTIIAKQYDQWWIKYPAYTVGLSVALQRMDDRQHWASDVIVGGAVGYWVAKTLVDRHKGKQDRFRIQPYASTNSLGIKINF